MLRMWEWPADEAVSYYMGYKFRATPTSGMGRASVRVNPVWKCHFMPFCAPLWWLTARNRRLLMLDLRSWKVTKKIAFCAKCPQNNPFCLVHRRQLKNRHIWKSRQLSNLQVHGMYCRSIEIFKMLLITWQDPRVSQILRFVDHAYWHYPLQAMCFLLMHTTYHNM